MKNVDLTVYLFFNCNIFMHPTIHSILILSSVHSANLLLACVVAFCNSHRILQFEDTVRQRRYYVDTYYLTILLYTIPRYIGHLRKSRCLSISFNIDYRSSFA